MFWTMHRCMLKRDHRQRIYLGSKNHLWWKIECAGINLVHHSWWWTRLWVASITPEWWTRPYLSYVHHTGMMDAAYEIQKTCFMGRESTKLNNEYIIPERFGSTSIINLSEYQKYPKLNWKIQLLGSGPYYISLIQFSFRNGSCYSARHFRCLGPEF